MRALATRDILGIWATLRGESPTSCAVALLQAACPDLDAEACRRLGVGERDARLLTLRELIFGPLIEGHAECPECGEALGFDVDSRALRASADSAPLTTVEADGFHVEIRSPDTNDILDAAECVGIDAARALLVDRCVVQTRRGGRTVEPNHLPVHVLDAVATRLAELNPHSVVELQMQCPSCGVSHHAQLDVVTFVWSELEAHARQLLRDVDALARTYGWSEEEILSLTPARRRLYVEMVTE